jgi:hypothetical protein
MSFIAGGSVCWRPHSVGVLPGPFARRLHSGWPAYPVGAPDLFPAAIPNLGYRFQQGGKCPIFPNGLSVKTSNQRGLRLVLLQLSQTLLHDLPGRQSLGPGCRCRPEKKNTCNNKVKPHSQSSNTRFDSQNELIIKKRREYILIIQNI